MSSQQDFLRFTDYKNNFELEEFKQFLATFDFQNPDFLTWIEHNQASYIYFQFYTLLVKNYFNQQQNIAKIFDFILAQKNAKDYLITLIKEVQKKQPDILDLAQFERLLLEHLKQQDISTYFSQFGSLFHACCLYDFRFQKLPAYLMQYVTIENDELIQTLTHISYVHNQDYGILDKLLEFSQQGHRYHIYYDFKNWLEKTGDLVIKEKIATISQYILNNYLKNPTLYLYETYLQSLKNHQANSIEGYIDFLEYLPITQTQDFLNQLVENSELHIAIRFEAVLVYFLTFKQQHPLKQQLTHQLLTLPLDQRWGGSSSNHGLVHNSNLFKQTDFFSLDEVLLALNSTQWCYEACKALYNYSDDFEIKQKIITTVIDAVSAMIQQMLKVYADDYVNAAPIGYLAHVLKSHDLNSSQRQQLEHILLDGLEQCIDHFSEQRHVHKELIEIIHSLGFKVPDPYFDLLGTWEKYSLKWQEQGLSKEKIFQMLIDAEAIPANKVLNPDYSFPYCLFPENEEEDKGFLMYNPRDDEALHIALFNKFFPYKVKWLWRDEDILNIPSNQLIHLNHVNPELEWKSIEDFYFQCNEQYYHFFIYDFMSRDWVNHPSIMAVFHQILQYFNINKVIYSISDIDGFGEYNIYFSAHPDKFEKLNQTLQTPCENIATFFIPEAKTLQFLAIEDKYKSIIQAGGFVSGSDQTLIKIPETESMTTKQAQQWLINNKNEMRHQALNYLAQDDFTQKAIDIRNLFISLALNMVGDYCVANNLKKQFPLWKSTRYQNKILNFRQKMDLLETIFNTDDLATHLKYPYD